MEDSSRSRIEEILASLDERELLIIRLYYGFGGNERISLEKIGGRLNLTRERVRQLKERALNKLRHPSRCNALMAVCD